MQLQTALYPGKGSGPLKGVIHNIEFLYYVRAIAQISAWDILGYIHKSGLSNSYDLIGHES